MIPVESWRLVLSDALLLLSFLIKGMEPSIYRLVDYFTIRLNQIGSSNTPGGRVKDLMFSSVTVAKFHWENRVNISANHY